MNVFNQTERVEARERLEIREHRIDATVGAVLTSSGDGEGKEVITAEELKETLEKQSAQQAAETTEFVASYMGR